MKKRNLYATFVKAVKPISKFVTFIIITIIFIVIGVYSLFFRLNRKIINNKLKKNDSFWNDVKDIDASEENALRQF